MATKTKEKPRPESVDRHGIGGNQPPRHESFAMALEDLRLEAGNFLDGAEIENQRQADTIGQIVTAVRKLRSEADAARKEDKEPHLRAGQQVDETYRPILTTAENIIRSAQRPLTVWLEAIEEAQRKEAEAVREEARRVQDVVLQAQREAEQQGNLEALEKAQAMQDEADRLHKDAKLAEKAKPQVAGIGRAMGLRTVSVAVVEDHKALLQYIMRTNPEPLREWLGQYAQRALPAVLPGVKVEHERRAQ